MTGKSHPPTGHNALAEALGRHRFTQGLPPRLLKKLSALAREVRYGEDEIVFRAGERAGDFGLLLSGSACVELRAPFYGMTIQILSAGDAFGWSALLDERHTVFQVRAREPSTAICLDGRRLIEACRGDDKLAGEIFHRLSELMARRVSAVELRLAEFCGSARCQHASGGESGPQPR